MKNSIFLIIFLFCNILPGFSEEDTPKKIENLYQFEIEVGIHHFETIINSFNSSPKGDSFSIAGFLFYPIIDENIAANKDTIVETKGLGVALCYWDEELRIETSTRRKIMVHGLGSIEESIKHFKKIDAHTCTIKADEYFVMTKKCEASMTSRDKHFKFNTVQIDKKQHPSYNCQEFELVYLDYNTYQDFSKNDRFYSRDRSRTFQGLAIERGLINLDTAPAIGTCSLDNYRTLNVRPAPYAPLANNNSTSSIAYSIRPNCPPHWRSEIGITEGEKEELAAISMENIIGPYIEPKSNEATELVSVDWKYASFALSFLFILALLLAFRKNR